MKKNFLLAVVAVGFVACNSALDALATDSSITLKDNNTEVTFSFQDKFGMKNWYVDGVSQLYRQQFYYRIGSTDYERPIDSLNLWNITQTSDNSLSLVYGKRGLKIEVSYLLSGGVEGSGYSTISEQIKISNLSRRSIDFHFFQFVDFDLAGEYLGDELLLIQNEDGLFTGAYQRKGNSYFGEELLSPGANRAQADEVYPTWPLFDSLVDSQPTTLNNSAGPISGDPAWAFQWDQCIDAKGSFEISIVKTVYPIPVPEPSVFAIVSLVGVVVAARKRIKS